MFDPLCSHVLEPIDERLFLDLASDRAILPKCYRRLTEAWPAIAHSCRVITEALPKVVKLTTP